MQAPLFPDACSWAEAHFGPVRLGLASRRDRLVRSASRLALRPEGSLPSKFDWNELRGFYDLMHRPESTPDALLAGHYDLTRRQMDAPGAILIVHDTTELDFTTHPALEGAGPIGKGTGRGFLQHNSLAVRAEDGLLLGLAYQQAVVRRPAPPDETRTQRRRRERESVLWERGFRGVGPAPEGRLWVDVCDRGGDAFEALHASRALGHHALIRASQDRLVLVERDGRQEQDYLMRVARGLPPAIGDVVDIAGRGGRPGRRARVYLAAAEVEVRPPGRLPRREAYRPIRLWVVRVWEPEPPRGAEALEWVLLSTLETATPQEMLTRRDWYAMRWPTAEDFHQAEKTGCGEEDLRFRDAHAMGAALAVLSAVAVRVVQLRQVARAKPGEAAERVATPLEIEVVQRALGEARGAWTVWQFVRGLARLGGFLGRKGDGLPGWKVMWRGYRRLEAMLEGVRLAEGMRRGDTAAQASAAARHEAGP